MLHRTISKANSFYRQSKKTFSIARNVIMIGLLSKREDDVISSSRLVFIPLNMEYEKGYKKSTDNKIADSQLFCYPLISVRLNHGLYLFMGVIFLTISSGSGRSNSTPSAAMVAIVLLVSARSLFTAS